MAYEIIRDETCVGLLTRSQCDTLQEHFNPNLEVIQMNDARWPSGCAHVVGTDPIQLQFNTHVGSVPCTNSDCYCSGKTL